MATACGVARSQRSKVGAFGWAELESRMDVGRHRCGFAQERQTAAENKEGCRGAQACRVGGGDWQALRRRSLVGELRGLSGHEERNFSAVSPRVLPTRLVWAS